MRTAQDLNRERKYKYQTPKQVAERVQRLASDRATAESHWQEIADHIHPNRNNITTKEVTEGEKRFSDLLDNTGVHANELLGGALHGMMTSPNAMWFEMTTGSTSLDMQDDVRAWMQNEVREMHNILNNSNFHTEKHEMDLDQTAFGTGCMLMEDDDKDVVRFSTKFIADYYIDEDSSGRVNQIYRKWDCKPEDLIQEFGKEAMPKEVMDAFKLENSTQKFCVIHAIYPKRLFNPGDRAAQAYHSQYIIKDLEFEIKTGSFDSLPYLTPRWSKAAGEKYGRGPGSVALPECKVLNKMNETMLIGAQKLVDPPVQLPDDGFILPLITSPGGINYRRSGNSDDIIRPIFNDTRLDFGYQALEDRRKRIRDAFYVDQLRLQQGGPMMTATEVMQRTEEQMRLLGPMLGRQQSEFLKPMVDRLFLIRLKRGMVAPPPDVLRGANLGVRYSSFIARSQRLNEAQNVMRWFESCAPFIQLDPTTRHVFDGDAAIRTLAMVFNPPQEIIRSQKEVEQIKKQEQEQQQAMQEQMAAQAQLQQGAQATQAMGAVGGTEQAV